MHITEYLGKALLARLYLKVKVDRTNLVYIIYQKSHVFNEIILFGFSFFEDSSDLENLPFLVNIE